ncbi:SDR family NAD(P)-dependent oxidoreductase [Bacillus timonensis]|uniref:SDR family NAD(P)-dependent oxidoreductase n=1 Tax=Bacillus timonensis TaxID=1033734 RepID=UPI00028A1721|nr:SDR family oxidoreductase [Bacillus timonensis]
MNIKDRMDLSDKCSIVTGGSRGLGLAMAKALAEYGSNIVIADINEENSEELIQNFNNDYGVKAKFVKVDVTDENQVRNLVQDVKATFGKIDVLINNAGIASVENAEDMSYENWKRVIDINLNGTFLVAREVGKQMIEQQNGSIINISSMSGMIVNTPQNQCGYNSSKAGVIMLTKSLAVEWAKHNIRVNSIAPGYMNTVMNHNYLRGRKATYEKWLELTPMHRLGEPEELGALAVFLASQASSFITGSIYNADGGYVAL